MLNNTVQPAPSVSSGSDDLLAAHGSTAPAGASLRRVPGPGTPAFLDTIAYMGGCYPFLRALARRYGDVFKIRMVVQGDLLCFSHPEAIRQIFTASPDHYQAAIGNNILLPFLGKNSLLFLDGDRHLRERRLLMPPFHGERMRHYGELIRDCTTAVTRAWMPGHTIPAAPFMAELSLEAILGAVFGITRGERHATYKRALLAAIDTVTGPMLFLPWLRRDYGPFSPGGKKTRAFADTRALILEEIASRRATGDTDRQDIMSLLLGARDEEGQPMSDEELHDELLTLLFAGHETTGMALAWALFWIHRTPGVLERLRAELDALGPTPDPDQASRLPYLDAVCKETLRIRPVIPVASRAVVKPMAIQGYGVDPGQRVFAAIYLTHRREDLYPEPERFRPERFLERKFTPYEYLPFGGGVRRCLGMAFALYEMKVVLATLVSLFDLELGTRLPVVGVRKSIALAPSGGPRIRVRGRR